MQVILFQASAVLENTPGGHMGAVLENTYLGQEEQEEARPLERAVREP